MKIWIKNILGILLGTLLFFIVPEKQALSDFLDSALPILIQMMRYVLLPLLLFSTAHALIQLRKAKEILKIFPRMLLYTPLVTLSAIILGTGIALLFEPQQIPIVNTTQEYIWIPRFGEILAETFPSNFFRLFVNDGNILIPLYVLAFFLGFAVDIKRKDSTGELAGILEALSRLFYKINSMICELVFIGLIAFSFHFLLQMAGISESFSPENSAKYLRLILISSVSGIAVVLLLFPLLSTILLRKPPRLIWLFRSLGAATTAFFTGDLYTGTVQLYKQGKESMGIEEKAGSPIYPFTALFSRPGTAVLAAISFITILKSFSSLEIPFSQILWIAVFSFIGSFLLFTFPRRGILILTAFLCSRYYIAGFEEGFLILVPIIPILGSIAAAIDTFASALIAYLITENAGMRENVPFRESV